MHANRYPNRSDCRTPQERPEGSNIHGRYTRSTQPNHDVRRAAISLVRLRLLAHQLGLYIDLGAVGQFDAIEWPKLAVRPTLTVQSSSGPGLSGRMGYHVGTPSSPRRTAKRLPSRSQVIRMGVPDDSGPEFAMKLSGGLTSGCTAFL